MKPNIILISLDTLRADVAYSGKFDCIERMRRKGTAFLNTVSSVPLTPPSHATIFTGLQPPEHGIRHLLKEKLNPHVRTLAEILRDSGYRTGGVVSCPGMNSWYDLGRGFEFYDDAIPPLADGRNALEVVDVKLRGTALKRAPMVTEKALAWVRGVASQPFFLFAHYFDAHWPYEAPQQVCKRAANAYEAEVAFADHHAGRLLDGLSELTNGFQNTILVLLSDHGEDLAGWYEDDHAGTRGHPEEEGHGCLLYDVTQLVPLIISFPSRVASGVKVDTQVRLTDVMPTILDLAGIAAPQVSGQSLVPLLDGVESDHRIAYFETYFREELAARNPEFATLRPMRGLRIDNRYKVVWEEGSERVQLYDLLADPCERSPTEVVRVP